MDRCSRTIEELRSAIEDRTNIPVRDQQLKSHARMLPVTGILADFQINDGCTVYLSCFLRGGAKNPDWLHIEEHQLWLAVAASKPWDPQRWDKIGATIGTHHNARACENHWQSARQKTRDVWAPGLGEHNGRAL